MPEQNTLTENTVSPPPSRSYEDRDALLRHLAGRVSNALNGNNIVDSIGGAVVFIAAALDIAGHAETTAWAAGKLRQVADVLDRWAIEPPASDAKESTFPTPDL